MTVDALIFVPVVGCEAEEALDTKDVDFAPVVVVDGTVVVLDFKEEVVELVRNDAVVKIGRSSGRLLASAHCRRWSTGWKYNYRPYMYTLCQINEVSTMRLRQTIVDEVV